MTKEKFNLRKTGRNQQREMVGKVLHNVILKGWLEVYKRIDSAYEVGRMYMLEQMIRLVNDAFHRYSRKGSKRIRELQVESNYWNRMKPSIERYIEHLVDVVTQIYKDTPDSNLGLANGIN